jgi:hypothetical protein
MESMNTGREHSAIEPHEEIVRKKSGLPIYVTLNDLGKMNVKSFNRNVRVDFKPTEFLLDSSEDELGNLTKKKKKLAPGLGLDEPKKQKTPKTGESGKSKATSNEAAQA